MPEETLNVLITVMSEGELHVPRLGRVRAGAGLPPGRGDEPVRRRRHGPDLRRVYDRTCRIAMGYQSAADEAAIVPGAAPSPTPAWRAEVVDWCAAPATHPDVRVGSSVRGAIDLVGWPGGSRAAARGRASTDWHVGLDAALVALSGRIRMRESCARARPRTSSASSTRTVFGAPPDAGPDEPDGRSAGGSLSPPRRRAARQERRTGARSAAPRTAPAVRARAARSGSASVAARSARSTRRRWPGPGRRPRRYARAARRSHRRPPTSGCARRRGGWPRG